MWLPATSLFVALAALALVWVAVLLARGERWTSAALVMTAAAFILRAYAASDLALHPWDERFHALVAKHLIETPLVPTLYADAPLPYDYRDWTGNHVWVHKPPLSLWFMAASMRVFGVSEIPMRLPSILFSSLSVLLTFFIGRALFSAPVGLIAAAFHAFNGFLVDLAAGRRASDHVDMLLIFLFEAGMLGAILASRRPLTSSRRLPGGTVVGVVVGFACGAAWLTKGLPAILVLVAWIAIRLQDTRGRVAFREALVSAVVAFAVAAPWTSYVATTFPREWAYESAYAWRHVTEVLEEQGGPAWKYVADMPRYFGELVYVPLAFAIASVVTRRTPSFIAASERESRRAVLLWMAVPYVVFSLMATKMPAYVMIAAPAVFLIQAEFWCGLWRWRAASGRSSRQVWLAAALVVLAIVPARELFSPTGPLERRERNPQWARDLRALKTAIGRQRAVLFNVPTPVEAMFYTPYVAYASPPTADQIRLLRDRGYRLYVYEPGTSQQPGRVMSLTRNSLRRYFLTGVKSNAPDISSKYSHAAVPWQMAACGRPAGTIANEPGASEVRLPSTSSSTVPFTISSRLSFVCVCNGITDSPGTCLSAPYAPRAGLPHRTACFVGDPAINVHLMASLGHTINFSSAAAMLDGTLSCQNG